MALSEFLSNKKRDVQNVVAQMAERLTQVAKDVYVPKGANFPSTNSLAGGIVALNPRRVGKVIECTIVSTARSKRGYDYAKVQHDKPLRHVTFMPHALSYVDYAKGGTRERRYWRGYRAGASGSPRYASKYLDRAGAATKMDMLTILRSAL